MRGIGCPQMHRSSQIQKPDLCESVDLMSDLELDGGLTFLRSAQRQKDTLREAHILRWGGRRVLPSTHDLCLNGNNAAERISGGPFFQADSASASCTILERPSPAMGLPSIRMRQLRKQAKSLSACSISFCRCRRHSQRNWWRCGRL